MPIHANFCQDHLVLCERGSLLGLRTQDYMSVYSAVTIKCHPG